MAATDVDVKKPILLDVPLEIRHTIFKYVAIGDRPAKKLFQQWFEKKDIAAQKSRVPDAVAMPAPGDYDTEPDEQDEDQEDVDDDNGNEDEEDEQQGDGGDQAEEAEDIGQEQQEEELEQEQGPEQELEVEMEEAEAEQHIAQDDSAIIVDNGENMTAEAEQIDDQAVGNVGAEEAQSGDQVQLHEVDQEMGEGEEEAEEPVGDGGGDGGEGEGEEANGENDGDNAAATLPPPPPVVQAHRKWRHVRKFLRINMCPPPLDLLLVCSQLKDEALDWYYDAAVLDIKATTSFQHASFFEESLQDITDAAFSPMENIRRANVEIVYDTAWIRASEAIDDIFHAFLRQRLLFVVGILQRAPALKELTINWHDSAQDPETMAFKVDVLNEFYNLFANIEVKEHYIASDFEPNARSKEGRQRLEYQQFHQAMQSGCVEF